jgi:hypothetical protein
MWKAELEPLDDGRIYKLRLWRAGRRLRYADIIEGWQHSPAFRDFYLSLLADAPFDALFWESPPVAHSSISQAYECVLIDSPQLSSVRPNPAHFEPHFAAAAADQDVLTFENLTKDATLIVPRPTGPNFAAAAADQDVLTFENLTKDATLIVPRPTGPMHVYAHLAAFVRGAAEAQRHALLRTLACALLLKMNDRPTWLSTSGLGVYWLHVRLDARPKYYNFQPYKLGCSR